LRLLSWIDRIGVDTPHDHAVTRRILRVTFKPVHLRNSYDKQKSIEAGRPPRLYRDKIVAVGIIINAGFRPRLKDSATEALA
jgi:hypothetical protein